MKFEKISIRNFRNFENIEIGISNKNIFFGLNDIGKTNFLYGFQRCNKIIGEETLPIQSYPDDSIANKRTLYAENKEALDDIRANCGIFLSVVDLENDLDEVLHDNLCEYLDTSDPVAYLQKAKHFHMADLVEAITDADCRTIFGHYNFACLEEITK